MMFNLIFLVMETNRKDKESTFFFDSAKIMDIVKSIKIDHNAVRFNLQTNTIRSDSDYTATHTVLLTWDGPTIFDDLDTIETALHNASWANYLNENFLDHWTDNSKLFKPAWNLVATFYCQSVYLLQFPYNWGPDEQALAYCTVTMTDQSLHITIIEPMQ